MYSIRTRPRRLHGLRVRVPAKKKNLMGWNYTVGCQKWPWSTFLQLFEIQLFDGILCKLFLCDHIVNEKSALYCLYSHFEREPLAVGPVNVKTKFPKKALFATSSWVASSSNWRTYVHISPYYSFKSWAHSLIFPDFLTICTPNYKSNNEKFPFFGFKSWNSLTFNSWARTRQPKFLNHNYNITNA